MQGANLGATKQSKFFADPELTEISMRLYVHLLENDLGSRWQPETDARAQARPLRRTFTLPMSFGLICTNKISAHRAMNIEGNEFSQSTNSNTKGTIATQYALQGHITCYPFRVHRTESGLSSRRPVVPSGRSGAITRGFAYNRHRAEHRAATDSEYTANGRNAYINIP